MNPKYIQVLILVCVFGIQFFFEHIFPQRKELNDWRNERFNIGIGLLNIILTLLPAFGMVQLLKYIELKKLGLLNLIHVSAWLQLSTAILVLDLWMYFWHLLNHKISFLWRFHRFHHKDEKMNSTSALRFHIAELLLSYPGKALICLFFGINFIPLLVYECLFSASVIIHHSNISITEKSDNTYRTLFVSPIMHRIHHSILQEERNNNYGALFSFWDKLFKTWKQAVSGKITFGVDNKITHSTKKPPQK